MRLLLDPVNLEQSVAHVNLTDYPEADIGYAQVTLVLPVITLAGSYRLSWRVQTRATLGDDQYLIDDAEVNVARAHQIAGVTTMPENGQEYGAAFETWHPDDRSSALIPRRKARYDEYHKVQDRNAAQATQQDRDKIREYWEVREEKPVDPL